MNSSHNSNFSSVPIPPPLPPNVLSKERRTWTREEEEDALIVIMKKLVVNGLRQENSFRTGYLEAIEKELKLRFPGNDLTSTNATSKLSVWKRNYYLVLNMINTSGFGWNDSDNMISVEDDVWVQYRKVHPQVKSFQFKAFRYFQDRIEIFGKDRATGKNAQGPEDLAKTANQESYVPQFDADEFPPNYNAQIDFPSNNNERVRSEFPQDTIHVEEEIPDDIHFHGECNYVNMKKKDDGKKFQPTRKRSRFDSTSKDPAIVNLMDEFFKQQNESISMFVEKLDKRDESAHSANKRPEVVDKTKLVLEALTKIGTLPEETRLYFAYKITTDASVTDLFLNFSEGEHITFVNMMLSKKVLA